MAECFAQSTLKCGRKVPRAPGEPGSNTWLTSRSTTGIIACAYRDASMSLTGTKSAGAKVDDQMEQGGDREEAASRASHDE